MYISMKIIRKLFFFVAAVSLLCFGYLYYLKLTDGFSIHQMSSSLPACPQYTIPLDEAHKRTLQKILDQNFTYMGKGCQFYAFESDDQKYVIKFLKHKHLRPFSWLNRIPMPHKLREVADAKIARRKLRVERLFSSCKLAFQKMPEETGLVYIHLDRSPALEKTITLADKLGIKHQILVDMHEFILQKKAVTVKEAFASLSKEEIQIKIQQLVDLVMSRCEKGISDRDRSFVQNVAFTAEGDRALFIDIGQFYEDHAIVQPEEMTKDLEKRLSNLLHWTSRHFPQYRSLVEEKIAQIRSSSKT